jgi:hypothetical protein
MQKEDLNLCVSEPKREEQTMVTNSDSNLVSARLNVMGIQIKQVIELVNKLATKELNK